MSVSIDIFREYAEAARVEIDAALDVLLPAAMGPAAELHEAMRYAVLGGGKRLRPTLCMAACEACGGDRRTAITIGCGLEILHAFTLVHDDLPCMDDDDYRRGRLTVHKKFGEGAAVLAGDALHNLAYRVIAESGPELDDGTKVKVFVEFAGAVASVCEGQSLDIAGSAAREFDGALEFIHRNKTAALIRASVVCGALCAGADALTVEKLAEFGMASGELFQNVDDILDAAAGAEVTGKAGPSDAKKNKLTTVSAHGLDGAVALAASQMKTAAVALAEIPRMDVLQAFAAYVFSRIPENFSDTMKESR